MRRAALVGAHPWHVDAARRQRMLVTRWHRRIRAVDLLLLRHRTVMRDARSGGARRQMSEALRLAPATRDAVGNDPGHEPQRCEQREAGLGFVAPLAWQGAACARRCAISPAIDACQGMPPSSVLTTTTAAGNRQAFRWNARQGMVGLGFMPGGMSSMATAVSSNGAVIVGVGDATNGNPPTSSAAFRWTADAGSQRGDSLPGSSVCSAGGVSGDGGVVVGTCLQVNSTGYRWTATTGAVALSRFGGGSDQQSSAAAISLDGAVIVGAGHPVLTGAVLWTANGTATVLGKLPGDAEATATAVSRDGSVVVGSSTGNAGNPRAFRWTQQTGMVDLGNAIGGLLGSFATSVSGDGRVVVGWGPTATGDVALIWDADHGLRLLDAALAADYRTQVAGWKLVRATAISDDAHTIAGYGTNPQEQTEAWIVTLPH